MSLLGPQPSSGAFLLRDLLLPRCSRPLHRSPFHLPLHLAQQVRQGLAGLLPELLVQHGDGRNAVDAKTPEVIAQLGVSSFSVQ